jgi:hypothetical protein
MKKILLIASALFIAEHASAQKITIAPEVGVQMSKVSTGSSDTLFGASDADYKTGFRAGVNLAVDLRKISIHAGAFYSTKGAKSEFFGIKATINTNHIDVPIYVNYNIINKLGNQLFVGVGPYFSYCMSGKVKVKGSIFGQSIDESEDLNIGSDASDQIKSMDFGGNANIGFISSLGLYARASYSMGFANISNSSAANSELKTRGFALSVGYQVKL